MEARQAIGVRLDRLPGVCDKAMARVVAALGSADSNEAIRAMMTGELPTFTGR